MPDRPGRRPRVRRARQGDLCRPGGPVHAQGSRDPERARQADVPREAERPPERILPVIERIKTGIRGVGYVRLDDSAAWPERLDRPFPGPAPAPPAAAGKPVGGKRGRGPSGRRPPDRKRRPPDLDGGTRWPPLA